MADTGAVTKSGAKKAGAEANKFAKRRPDPAGLAKIVLGDAAFKEGNFAAAKDFYDEGKTICEKSTLEFDKKPKAPKELL